ncbi:hypothetical protein AB0H58_32910, partial [Nocardia neocaledoniensis]|uniref:hypothetical protein n=1 Tax=Nocardia neocaledoniensis TaxID=236511 RepID=UPI0033E6F4C4
LAHDVARRGRDALASGPWLGWRPWRLLAGVLLGAGCAVKLSGLAFNVPTPRPKHGSVQVSVGSVGLWRKTGTLPR